jgi:uncharacterized membrane protein
MPPLWIGHLKRIHRSLVDHSVYPSVFVSLLAVALLAGRMYRSRTTIFVFLLWNLFLAWIPYWSSVWADRLHRRRPRRWSFLLLPGALWIVFLPNAPYILTDIWHLQSRPPIPLWYDSSMLSAFALAGLFLAVFSLRTMQQLVRHYAGPLVTWVFVFVTVGLAGLGVYLGRFLRWNSWDLVLHPQAVLADVAVRVANPLSHLQSFVVTAVSAAILLACYLALTARPAKN